MVRGSQLFLAQQSGLRLTVTRKKSVEEINQQLMADDLFVAPSEWDMTPYSRLFKHKKEPLDRAAM